MGTNSADPQLMEQMAVALESEAGDIEAWGLAAANTMAGHGYHDGATSVAGGTYWVADWCRDWATSLANRASLLDAYDAIALMGAGAAGGAGPAIGAARNWAMAEPTTLAFQDWYLAKMATAAARRQGSTVAAALLAALDDDDYAAVWEAVHALESHASPEAVAAFFNHLGGEETAALPNQLVGMTSHGDVWLRASVGHPADLISTLSRMLATASHTDELEFSGSDLIAADLAADVLASPYLTGYGAEYLLIDDGFDGAFLAAAVCAFLPYATDPTMAQQVLVSSIHGQFPFDAREFLLPNVASAGGGAELMLQLLEDEELESLLAPRMSYDYLGATAVVDLLEQATTDLHRTQPEAARWVVGSLIAFVGEHETSVYADVVAGSILLVLPHLAGIMNGVAGQAWLGAPGGREVLVTAANLENVFRTFAEDDTAAAVLYEGLLTHYGALLDSSGGDPAKLNDIAISLAGLSALLTRAIAEAGIADAKIRDERVAATIGLIDTLAGLVPMPGAATVGSKFAANLIKTTYSELVTRGLDVLSTNHEGSARARADAFNDALLFSYTEFLTLGYLQTQGSDAIAASIDAFFASRTHLRRDLYDFSDGAGGLLTDLTDRQGQAYGEWILFASADPVINNAISRLLAEFLNGLPTYSD